MKRSLEKVFKARNAKPLKTIQNRSLANAAYGLKRIPSVYDRYLEGGREDIAIPLDCVVRPPASQTTMLDARNPLQPIHGASGAPNLYCFKLFRLPNLEDLLGGPPQEATSKDPFEGPPRGTSSKDLFEGPRGVPSRAPSLQRGSGRAKRGVEIDAPLCRDARPCKEGR